MDPDIYSVTYNIETKRYEVRQSGEIIAERVTEGATRAELIDRGMPRETADSKIMVAAQHAWQGA
jgi:hypothetical protein